MTLFSVMWTSTLILCLGESQGRKKLSDVALIIKTSLLLFKNFINSFRASSKYVVHLIITFMTPNSNNLLIVDVHELLT